MKTVAGIVLAVLLVAAIIFGAIIHGKYSDTKEALLISKKNSSELNEKVTQLTEEVSSLSDKIHEWEGGLKELEKAQKGVSKLEDTLKAKDERLAEFQEELSLVKGDLEKERKAEEALRTELKAKETTAVELQEKLRVSGSRILSLEQDLARGQEQSDELRDQLSDLEGEKASAESKMDQMQSTYEALIVKAKEVLEQERKAKDALRTELTVKDTMITELKDSLRVSGSRILSLEQEIARQQKQVGGLRDRLSDLEGEKTGVESKVDQLQTTYEALIADLKEQIEKREVTIESFQKRISVSFVDRILFDFGKETITPEGREVLHKVGGILRGVQGRRIRVIGHTDDIPILPKYRYRFPSNWELSAARAAAVIRHFQKETGLDPTNLEAVGRSFYHPVAGNETADGRSQNRRVEIIIAPMLK